MPPADADPHAASRYGGAAGYYRRGRLPYPPGLPAALAAALGLDGTGRLLDAGCGPGTLTLELAGHVAAALGVDRDPGMVAQARAQAAARGAGNARFRCQPVETLPPDLGPFRLITFGRSLHWLDPVRTGAALRALLAPGGTCAVLYAWSLRGDPDPDSPHPVPPYERLQDILAGYREGPAPVAHPGGEAPTLAAAGLRGPTSLTVPGGTTVTSTVDDLVARCLSRAGTGPGALGERLPALRADLAAVLSAATPTGRFAERLRDCQVNLWRR